MNLSLLTSFFENQNCVFITSKSTGRVSDDLKSMNQKSNLHYTIFALLRRSMSSRDEAYLHDSASEQHHSEKTRSNGEPFATLRPVRPV